MPEASGLTYMEGAVEGGADDWGEVVTRQPYRKVRLDHLLSKEESKGWFIIERSKSDCDFERYRKFDKFTWSNLRDISKS